MENFIFVQFKLKFVSHLQSQVFGAGYRSLPTMSEEEYFQLELKQGKIVQEYNQWVEYNSFFDPLSANPPNWSNTLKTIRRLLPTNCLGVFNHFVGLALKGLNTEIMISFM